MSFLRFSLTDKSNRARVTRRTQRWSSLFPLSIVVVLWAKFNQWKSFLKHLSKACVCLCACVCSHNAKILPQIRHHPELPSCENIPEVSGPYWLIRCHCVVSHRAFKMILMDLPTHVCMCIWEEGATIPSWYAHRVGSLIPSPPE